MTDLYTVALEAPLASDIVHALPSTTPTLDTTEQQGVSCA